ncbi:MAG TPA: hypothetical protein VG426_00010 [Candidatus Dormibacteraeota bacterium]|nr:hypothetical protein [Candidatus Dormibacteraeota bacterium]
MNVYIGAVDQTWTRALVWVAMAGLVAIDVLYLAIIHFQNDPGPADVLTVPFVATYLAAMAILLGASLVSPAPARPAFRAAASSGLLVLGLLAAFSIGVLVLVMAGLAIATTVGALGMQHKPRVLAATAVASLVAVIVLVGGLQLAWHYLVCPPTGSSGGTTAGFFGQVTYECDNGRLTTR